MLKFMLGFHHQVTRRVTEMMATRGAVREWEYPPVVMALEAVILHPIMEYNRRRQTTISEKVACCPIYELWVKVKQIPGTNQMIIWWYQDMVNEPEK